MALVYTFLTWIQYFTDTTISFPLNVLHNLHPSLPLCNSWRMYPGSMHFRPSLSQLQVGLFLLGSVGVSPMAARTLAFRAMLSALLCSYCVRMVTSGVAVEASTIPRLRILLCKAIEIAWFCQIAAIVGRD